MTEDNLPTIFVYVLVTILNYSDSASSSIVRPRVTRTNDAIIIDFTDDKYAAPYRGNKETPHSDGFIPLSSTFPNGWSYFYKYPSPITPPTFHSQFITKDVDIKQGTTTPVIQCGRGPAIFPKITNNFVPFRSSGKIAGYGTTNAKKDAWPFIVTMNLNGNILCAGALISESKVLSAAQCIEKLNSNQMSFLTVSIGMYSFSAKDARMTRRITKVVLNSQFDATTFDSDLAIITLESPVSFSKNVAPVCLPPASTDPNQYVDQNAIILGWGLSDILQQGKVSIVSNEVCRGMYDISRYVSDTTICITSDDVTTCKSDVGGPVVVMSSPGTWTLVGINSWADPDCATIGLKTRVSAFRSWIDQNMQN